MSNPSFRFYSPKDPLAPRVRWALEAVFKLPAAVIDAILSDQARRTLMRVADDGTLAGFIVFKDYKPVLLAPDNSFVRQDVKELLDSPRLKLYSFEQVWFRGEDFPMSRILREVLTGMSELLVEESTRHALLCLLPDGEANRPLRDLLVELGFHANPNVYCDFALELPDALFDGLSPAGAPPGFVLSDFTQPPATKALAETYAAVFGGTSAAAKKTLLRMLGTSSFAQELSFWVASGKRVAGFLWTFHGAPGVAKLNLLATHPDFRGQGVVRSCTPDFLIACQRLSVEKLTFTIRQGNANPARIAEALGAREYQRRQTFIRTR